MEKIAFCDFDGTLSKGLSAIEFMKLLTDKKIYPEESFNNLTKHRSLFVGSKTTHDELCIGVFSNWAEGIKNQFMNTIKLNAMEFVKTYKNNIYPSSYQLIKYLKECGYYTVLISASQHEIISLLGEELGFDEIHATKVKIKSGLYTGELITKSHLSLGKAEIMQELSEKYNVNLQQCIAMGDAGGDLNMLETAGIPIVLNPHKSFVNTVEEKGWPIFYHDTIIEKLRIRKKS
ncbi:MAG: HAD family phosphatase [Nanoarchaeota archaeon]|nr:HAD family phosphatase [Nanoarchaeota archaeon]